MRRWFEGFNDAAERHILGSIPLLTTAAEACDCHSVVIQAGGCYGLYPWILEEWFTEVVTFEPVADNMLMLLRNIAGSERIRARPEALDQDRRMVAMGVPHGNPGGSRAFDLEGGRVPAFPVETTRIDDIERNLPVGLIQLDVEGFELRALRGGVETIKADRPVIMYEHCHDDHGEVLDFLRSLGYQTWLTGPNDRVMAPTA